GISVDYKLRGFAYIFTNLYVSNNMFSFKQKKGRINMSKYIYDENVFLKIDNFDNIYFEEENSILNIRLVKIEDGVVKEFFKDDLKIDLAKYNNKKEELNKSLVYELKNEFLDFMDNEKEKIFDVIINLKELKEDICSNAISLA
ncbi:hypothetical protein, partial [Clostridium perfringens]|uniref:hypothetical protein n=2 Tax=Clostridium perfringens TaxID=1502 RepID=UPI003DA6AD9B